MNENTKTLKFALQVGTCAHDPFEDELRERLRGLRTAQGER